ncbi:MAG TPA: RagB/SusD family nutrient uptake outer membrane protein [Kofleriaceae bacterium]|jgi:hypothetical protein
MHSKAFITIGAVVGALAVSACDLDVPDLNNPGIDELESHPTAISIGVAATGLLIGNRTGHGNEGGYVGSLGILGRESYCFDSADPRFVREFLEGSLNPGSPFGGGFWGAPYANIRLANIILHAIDKVSDLTDANKHAIVGFTKTMMALDLLRVINTHDTNGAVVDTDHAVTDPLPPIVDKPTTFAAIVKLLDDAVPEISLGGDAFPFLFDDGFSGFDTPMTFLMVNRAIRARVAVYMGDYAKAITFLGSSFIADGDMVIDFDLGVYYTYTTKGGDVTNGLFTPNIYVHPSVTTDAQTTGGQTPTPDKRLTTKVTKAALAGSTRGLSSDQAFTLYTKPTSPISLIRNEELILLKAEALWFTGMKQLAIDELNLVRVNQGGLPKITAIPADDATFVTELLYERRYSLLFEGHRWIDVRRFNRQSELPIEKAPNGTPHKLNIRYPIPLGECNARPGEPRCMLGST